MSTAATIEPQSEASRDLETLSLRTPTPLADAARRSFESLTTPQQLRLASEVARSRRHDYTRLIDNVVHVVGGLRRRCDANGDEAIHYEPCVVFFVKRKWDSHDANPTPTQRIPEFLLSHADIDGVKTLCAVPTDVQLQDRLLDVKAQCLNAIYVEPPGGQGSFGALACLVQGEDATLYALSAIHVLSPALNPLGSGLSDQAQAFGVQSQANPPEGVAYLKATGFGGRLVAGPTPSFDVQWAAVLNGGRGRLKTALADLDLSAHMPIVESAASLVDLLKDGRRMLILVPANHHRFLDSPRMFPQATFSTDESEKWLDYEQDAGATMRVVHSAIELQIQAGERTESGDSGCPVVVPLDGGGFALVGMHIAGHAGFRTSFVVPAWQLFNPFAYFDVGGTLPDGVVRIRLQV